MIGILEPSHFSVSAISELQKIGKVRLYEGRDMHLFLKNVTVLFVRLNYKIDASILDMAKNVEFICTPTTGLNHIDLKYCRDRGIKILSLKGETSFLKTIRATPEHTLGLIIALYRNYSTAFLNIENNEWNREKHKGFEIYKSNIGIIGLGRVGTILSGYLKKMGASVGYYDISSKKASSGLKKYNSIESLIKNCETIVLCSSYHAETGSIINRKEIDMMSGKYFINTARAELTDEEYLVRSAAKGAFRGIAIDVITEEQTSQKFLDKWLTIAEKFNVIVTPHVGGATYTSMMRTEEFIVDKLKSEIGKK
jgi:D-3-phosphoglycerate dehydrogenase